jgi:hypothetical protein
LLYRHIVLAEPSKEMLNLGGILIEQGCDHSQSTDWEHLWFCKHSHHDPCMRTRDERDHASIQRVY